MYTPTNMLVCTVTSAISMKYFTMNYFLFMTERGKKGSSMMSCSLLSTCIDHNNMFVL